MRSFSGFGTGFVKSFRQNLCKMIYLHSLETPVTVILQEGEDFDSWKIILSLEELQGSYSLTKAVWEVRVRTAKQAKLFRQL